MLVKRRELNLINNLISGIGIIILGMIITIGNVNIYTRVINLLVFIFLIYGLSKLLNYILNKKVVRNNQALFGIIASILLALVMLLFPKISLSILPIIFSIYLLFNSVVKFVNYLILKEVNLKSRFNDLFFSIFFLIFSLIFLFYPLHELKLFITIIGVYSIILGVSRIIEFITDILSEKFKLKIKRKLRISLPVFFEAFLPKRALKSINKYIDYLTSEEKEKDIESDLKVFIHMSKYGFNQLGHMDIMFEDKVYSYGNYDKDSYKLFSAIGDGVLFIVNNKDEYLKFCIKNSRKTIVEYGIKLSNSQKEKIRNRLNEIINNTIEWEPLILREKKNKFIKNKIQYRDYASKLYAATKAKFYKFNDGEYKTYFVLGTNCSCFADHLMRDYVFEVLKLVGIISPGTYYAYLEENYRKRNSRVVTKKIYSKENIGDINVKNKK